jgi:predicted Rdx family selenoprotein
MIVIHYCHTCHFEAPARAIAQAIERETSEPVEIRRAFWGTFRIERDGVEIYNRWKTRGFWGRIGLGRAPTPEEILQLLRSSSGASVPTDS